MPARTPGVARVAMMLGAVYLFWGSTAPAMKVAIETLPPFVMMTLRFLGGGAILWTVARASGVALPRPREWPNAFVTTSFLLIGSNALFCWSLQTMPSGLGSLFFALSPLWMVVFAALLDGERITPLGVAGLGLGFAGMAMIFGPAAAQGLPAWAIAVDTFCSITWAFGSILQRRFASTDVLQTSAMQMLLAAPVTALIALALHERPHFESVSPASFGALAYLIVCGSVFGFSAYLWLTRNVATGLASTNAYVNPIVSIALGTLFLHEALRWNAAAGATVVLAGVGLMVFAKKPLPAAASVADPA